MSQGIEEIKIKSNEASHDIARGMREIKESTKAGVEKIGVALNLADTDAGLYTDVEETAGMRLAAHYSHALATIRANNRILVEKGEKTSEALSRVQQQTNREHDSVSALIKQCENLPEIVSGVDAIKSRCEAMLEKLVSVEALLGDAWEETVASQISVSKQAKEAELEEYRRMKRKELEKIEEELKISKESITAQRRTKALAKTAEFEDAESQANKALREELDASIKKGMDEYLIYGFSAKSKSSSSPSSSNPDDPSAALASIQLTSQTEELDDFLGAKDASPKAPSSDDEDESLSTIKVDTTTIDAPEV